MDSDSENERPTHQEPKEKSRRPPNTAFRQQRLKAWQPIFTPKTVLPLLLCITVIFAPLGGALIYGSDQVQEIIIDYSHCHDQASTTELKQMDDKYITTHFNTKDASSKVQWQLLEGTDEQKSRLSYNGTCRLTFDVPHDMGAPIYMYYRLTNFYQNHRRYVTSYNEDQLNGKPKNAHDLKDKNDCKPLVLNDDGKPYYPCGLIANSMFNDTFHAPVALNPSGNQDNVTYDMTTDGIAWGTDKNRFKKTRYNATDVVPPPFWIEKFPDGYTEENIPDISEWQEFQNWMRTAALPTFSKLVMRQDHNTLTEGTYSVDVDMYFPVLEYDGTKSLVLTTRSAVGGRNPFLGIAYVVVAGICAIVGLLFLGKHLVKPRRLGDHSYLSWNNEN